MTQPQLYQSYAIEKIVSFFGAPGGRGQVEQPEATLIIPVLGDDTKRQALLGRADQWRAE